MIVVYIVSFILFLFAHKWSLRYKFIIINSYVAEFYNVDNLKKMVYQILGNINVFIFLKIYKNLF